MSNIRTEYATAHPTCENPLHRCFVRLAPGACGAEIHHILGGMAGRVDEWWNLLTLCTQCHYVAERSRASFRTLLSAVKASRGEWDGAAAWEARHGPNAKKYDGRWDGGYPLILKG